MKARKSFHLGSVLRLGYFVGFNLKSTKGTEFSTIMPEPPSCLSGVWIPSVQNLPNTLKHFTQSTQVQFLETGHVEILLISEAGLCRVPGAGTVWRTSPPAPCQPQEEEEDVPLVAPAAAHTTILWTRDRSLMKFKNVETWQKASFHLLLAIFNPNQLLEATHGVTLQAIMPAQWRNAGTN